MHVRVCVSPEAYVHGVPAVGLTAVWAEALPCPSSRMLSPCPLVGSDSPVEAAWLMKYTPVSVPVPQLALQLSVYRKLPTQFTAAIHRGEQHRSARALVKCS